MFGYPWLVEAVALDFIANINESHCMHLSLKNLPFCQRAGNRDALITWQNMWSKFFVKGEEPGKKNKTFPALGFIFLFKIAGGSQGNVPFVLSLVMHAHTLVQSNIACEQALQWEDKTCKLKRSAYWGSIFRRSFIFSRQIRKSIQLQSKPHSKILTPP